MKLFEYMASGTPIVASNVPAIREILDEESAYFVEPDNPAALAGGIEKALNDAASFERAKRARGRAENYTWLARAKRILSGLENPLKTS
jgi:glycosyltransferase involved in cell wall biosynthesis